ncbi:MAG: glutathione synthetase [Kangiellaceae bacterium]|jgi:MtN3 and saliva related transmembrane protein|nr:glutathione synthetase [Kangiellaceae bacterium]|tara:strand:- start:1641 stop:1904 length:264 start_codon:yes stop_codon:yes gene_type:complete
MISTVTLIGFIAAFCTTTAFVPQVVHTLKTRDTSSISLSMYAIFVTGVVLWLIYGCLLGDWAIITANAVTFSLASIVLVMKWLHSRL